MSTADDRATTSGTAEQRGGEPAGSPTTLRDLLAGYDREVEAALREALDADTGLDRVRALHNTLGRSIAVHDAVLASALCPQLEDLPGGAPVAARLRKGCEERADLLRRFRKVSHNVAPHNVYPVSGDEVEEILEGLQRSFTAHVQDETTEVGAVLEAAAGSTDPDVVAARMAIEAQNAPTRVHAAITRHPRSGLLKRIYRFGDRIGDWNEHHQGWTDPRTARRSPRAEQVALLKDQPTGAPPSVRELLAGYDATVEALIGEMQTAATDVARADATFRLFAAIAVHDSVLGGVLCPLLDAVPDGKPLAERLRAGCRRRAELAVAWDALTDGIGPEEIARLGSPEAEAIITPLVESFRDHEHAESTDVIALLDKQPDSAYRTKTSLLNDMMWPWYSEGAGALALRMALWAETGPTRVHPALVKHPTNRVLKGYYHRLDGLRDRWGDTTAGKWIFPALPARPFAGEAGAGTKEPAEPADTPPSAKGG